MHRARLAASSLAVTACVLGLASVVPAQRNAPGYAWDEPDWRFTHHDRRVKVVLLAGSIGAFRDRPYGRLLHRWCENAEIRNLSHVGEGAAQLAARFRTEVLDNPSVPVGARGTELWLLFGGGLNSVGIPQRTNAALRELFELAHRRRVGVVALTLTPWGSDDESEHAFTGARGLHMLRSTRSIVDFVLGRSSPEEALGSYARERRGDPSAPWLESERPDVAIDLYDSPLRDRHATPWPLAEVRAELERDPAWQRETRELDAEAQRARLEADARALAQAPRWFLAPHYRAFDDVHPNREGHRVIAETICPALPRTWGCRCPGAVD